MLRRTGFGGVVLGLAGLLSIGGAALADYPRLRESREPALQQALDHSLKQMKLVQAVRELKLAVTVVDLRDPEHPRMAGVNGMQMFYSASLPKIAILLAAYQRIEDGEMPLDAPLRRDLEAMIRVSSNPAATRVLERVGRDYLLTLLQSERYLLYDQDLGGGLWVGKPYGSGAAYRRDPLHQLSHGATTLQVARFYYLLETGRLVSPAASLAMKDMLGRPAIRHKFVKGLSRQYPEAEIFRKSGTWRDYHADSAIIRHDGKHYIVVALSHDPRGSQWLEQLVLEIDRLMPASPDTSSNGPPRR